MFGDEEHGGVRDTALSGDKVILVAASVGLADLLEPEPIHTFAHRDGRDRHETLAVTGRNLHDPPVFEFSDNAGLNVDGMKPFVE